MTERAYAPHEVFSSHPCWCPIVVWFDETEDGDIGYFEAHWHPTVYAFCNAVGRPPI